MYKLKEITFYQEETPILYLNNIAAGYIEDKNNKLNLYMPLDKIELILNTVGIDNISSFVCIYRDISTSSDRTIQVTRKADKFLEYDNVCLYGYPVEKKDIVFISQG